MSQASSVLPAFHSIKSLPPEFKFANNPNPLLVEKHGDVKFRRTNPIGPNGFENGALVGEISKEVRGRAGGMDLFDEDSPYGGKGRSLKDRPSNADEDSVSVTLPLPSILTSSRENRWNDTNSYGSKKKVQSWLQLPNGDWELVKTITTSGAESVISLPDGKVLKVKEDNLVLEEAGYETWAVDILEKLPSCDVVSKRDHFYQFWKSHIRKAMILVGPSLGSAVAIDFAVNYPEAVEKLVLIDASVYAEGTGNLATLPRAAAYAGAYVLKSIPLRLYANYLSFTNLSFSTSLDWTNVGRLHCLLPWWEDATVDFMTSGGYNVVSQIKKVKQKTLIIWGENDRIISSKLGVRLHCELPDAIIRQIPDCGHLPHVERPDSVVKLIVGFVQNKTKTANECVSPL